MRVRKASLVVFVVALSAALGSPAFGVGDCPGTDSVGRSRAKCRAKCGAHFNADGRTKQHARGPGDR